MCILTHFGFLLLIAISICNGAPYQRAGVCGYEVRAFYLIYDT